MTTTTTADVGYDIRDLLPCFHMNDQDAINSFVLACRLKNLRPKTIHNYLRCLRTLSEHLFDKRSTLLACEPRFVREWVVKSLGRMTAESVNHYLRHWRVFYRHCVEQGFVIADPTEKIGAIKTDNGHKTVLSQDDVKRIISHFTRRSWRTYENARNAAMTRLMFDGMLRSGEARSLLITDLDLANRVVRVRATTAKGRRERHVPLSACTCQSIHTYLIRHRKGWPGPLLFPDRRGRRLTATNLSHTFCRISEKLGIYVTPHLLRHSAATFWIEQGGSVAILQRILGHASIKTTEKYLHMSDRAVSEAHDLYAPGNF